MVVRIACMLLALGACNRVFSITEIPPDDAVTIDASTDATDSSGPACMFATTPPISLELLVPPSAIRAFLQPNQSNPSLAVALPNLNALRVYDAGFGRSFDYGTGTMPRDVAVGEIDGDNVVELLTANSTANSIGLVDYSSGKGSVGNPVASIHAPISLALGTFGDDTVPDLVAVDGTGELVMIATNSGNGMFAAPTSVAAPAKPFVVLTTDVDDNDHPDLLIGGKDAVRVYSGIGSHNFVLRQDLVVLGLDAIATGDLDTSAPGDEVVVATTDNKLAVYMFDVAGNEYQVKSVLLPTRARAIAVADFDEDSIADVIVALDSKGVILYRGHGDGSLTTGQQFVTPGRVVGIAVADFDDDNTLDVAFATDDIPDVEVYACKR